MKNKMIKRFTGVITAIFMVIIFSGVSIFGSQAQTLNDENGGSVDVTTDGQYIYLDYTGSWTNYIQQSFDISINGEPVSGALSKLVINTGNNGDGSSFSVLNSWYQTIDGATGYTENSDPSSSGWGYENMSWRAKVPVSIYGTDIADITVSWNGSSVDLTVTDDTSSEDTTESDSEAATEDSGDGKEDISTETSATTEQVSESTTEQETTEKTTEKATSETGTTEEITGPVTSGLVVDGYYGEWSQYPSADITYQSNNGYSVHKGQLAVENGRLYVHFSMNDLYTAQMQFHLWNITVDGKSCVLNVLPVNSDGSINWGGQTSGFGNGIYRDFGVFAGYYNDVDGDVAFTVYDSAHTETGRGDEIEFSISLDKLADYLGIKIDQGATITVSNPNIGAEGVTITGTPTGPWAGAAIALIMSVAGIVMYRRKMC